MQFLFVCLFVDSKGKKRYTLTAHTLDFILLGTTPMNIHMSAIAAAEYGFLIACLTLDIKLQLDHGSPLENVFPVHPLAQDPWADMIQHMCSQCIPLPPLSWGILRELGSYRGQLPDFFFPCYTSFIPVTFLQVKEGDIIDVDSTLIIDSRTPGSDRPGDTSKLVRTGRVMVKEVGEQTKKGRWKVTLQRHKNFKSLKQT